jgi:hypothetical protein
VDPIHPIAPRPPAILPVASSRSPRVTREQQRDDAESQKQGGSAQERSEPARKRPLPEAQQQRYPIPAPPPELPADDDGHPHIDVRA